MEPQSQRSSTAAETPPRDTATTEETTSRPNDGRSDESLGGLAKRLSSDLSDLVTKEIALARAEVSESVNDAKKGVGSVAAGGGVLFSGFLVLLASAVIGLSTAMADWLAALIVGAVVAIIGYGMVSSGRKKMQPQAFRPSRTEEQVKRDQQMAKEKAR